jgi:hypothetical protein
MQRVGVGVAALTLAGLYLWLTKITDTDAKSTDTKSTDTDRMGAAEERQARGAVEERQASGAAVATTDGAGAGMAVTKPAITDAGGEAGGGGIVVGSVEGLSKKDKQAAKKLARQQAKQFKQKQKVQRGEAPPERTPDVPVLIAALSTDDIYQGLCVALGCVGTDVASLCHLLCASGEPVATRIACHLSEELIYRGTCNMFNGRFITKRLWTIARFHVYPRSNTPTKTSNAITTTTTTVTTTTATTTTTTTTTSSSSGSSGSGGSKKAIEAGEGVVTFDISLRVEKDPKNFQVTLRPSPLTPPPP